MDTSSDFLKAMVGKGMALWSNESDFASITAYAEYPARFYCNYSTLSYTPEAVKFALCNYSANKQLLIELSSSIPEEFI